MKRIPVARLPPRLVSFKQKQIELSFRSIDRPVITQFNKTLILGPKIILTVTNYLDKNWKKPIKNYNFQRKQHTFIICLWVFFELYFKINIICKMKVFYEIEFCVFGEFGKFFIIESVSYFKTRSMILVFTLMNRLNSVKSITRWFTP